MKTRVERIIRMRWDAVGDGFYGYPDGSPAALYAVTPDGARSYKAYHLRYTLRGRYTGATPVSVRTSEARAKAAAERAYAALRQAVIASLLRPNPRGSPVPVGASVRLTQDIYDIRNRKRVLIARAGEHGVVLDVGPRSSPAWQKVRLASGKRVVIDFEAREAEVA